MYIKTELVKNWLKIVKQAIYLIPIISISLLFSTAQNMKYMNQRSFLDRSGHSFINKTDQNAYSENCFTVYNGELVTMEDNRGAKYYKTSYNCEIYSIVGNKYNFEGTYFTKSNLNGQNPMNLKSNEIIISYDAARRLEVSVGDTTYFISDINEEALEFTIKGIMDTKYAYQKIGSVGTAIINSQNESKSLNQMYPDYHFATFASDKQSENAVSISLQEEKQETNFLALPMNSVIVVNVVFPVLAFLLIFILLYRENKHLFMRKRKHISILVSLGGKRKEVIRIISSLQLFVIVLASFLAILVYKYGLMEGYVGEKADLTYLLRIFLACLIIGYVSVKINKKLLQEDFEKMDVAKLLSEREDTM